MWEGSMTRKFLIAAAIAVVALTSSISVGTAEARWCGPWRCYYGWAPAHYYYHYRPYWPGYRYYYPAYYYGPRCFVNGWGARVC
jgi:hypothetical protein